jgi:hypothetical protein
MFFDAKVAYENLNRSHNMLWKLTAAVILFAVITTVLMFLFAYSDRKAQTKLQKLRQNNERLHELQTYPWRQSQSECPHPHKELPVYSTVADPTAPRESGPAVPREVRTHRGREESEGIGIALGNPDLEERFRFNSTLRSA